MDQTIVDDAQRSRFELHVDGHLGAFAEYVRGDGVITFTHTVTLPSHRGQGLAGVLVREALDRSRDAGLRVVPRCPYVAKFIGDHPEYADLVRQQ